MMHEANSSKTALRNTKTELATIRPEGAFSLPAIEMRGTRALAVSQEGQLIQNGPLAEMSTPFTAQDRSANAFHAHQ